MVLSSGRPSLGLWIASFAKGTTPHSWKFANIAKEHNAHVVQQGLKFPTADAEVVNVTSVDNAGPAHRRYDRGSTSYTSLLLVDAGGATHTFSNVPGDADSINERSSPTASLIVAYDRLAHGWAGPPGPLGTDDYIFHMLVNVSRNAAV